MPVSVVNATVPPGMTDFVSAVATGGVGNATVGVMVASSIRPLVSATTYFTAVATPVKDDNGSKVTVPLAFTVYVPCPATSSVVKSHNAFAVAVVAHNFTLVATMVAGVVAVSLVKIVIVWFVSYAPDDVSFTATGAGGMTGVKVDVAF